MFHDEQYLTLNARGCVEPSTLQELVTFLKRAVVAHNSDVMIWGALVSGG